MPILLTDYFAYSMADDYADFIQALESYYDYCLNKSGNNKNDYKKEYEIFKDAYLGIFQYEDDNVPPPHIHRIIAPCFEEIDRVFKKRTFNDASISKIANALGHFWKIENSGVNSFRDLCLEYRIESACKLDYPNDLYIKVKSLLENEEYDAAIVESFKYIDGLLQDILNLPAHEYYGENLINAAFSLNTGKLQLNTNPNEQAGLRNFFSGANAIFRNPSAHRSQFLGEEATYFRCGEEFALTVVRLVSLMSTMIKNILYRLIDADVTEILVQAAQKNNWALEVGTGLFSRSWTISNPSETSGQELSHYKVNVFLKQEKGGFILNIFIHESVSLDVAYEIRDQLQQKTNISTIVKKRNK